jgi:hypothetical protein
LQISLNSISFGNHLSLVPTSLRITLIAPLALEIDLLLLLLDLLLNFLNLLDLFLLIVLKLPFASLWILRLISHLAAVGIDVQLHRILAWSALIIGWHLFLALILLNFLNFVVGSLINFILWLRSFLNLIWKNNMRMLIRRLVIFRIIDLTLVLWLRSIVSILRYHLLLRILLLIRKTNRIVRATRTSPSLLSASIRLLFGRYLLLT